VVAYRVAGVPEVVSENAGGTLVECGNPIALADAVVTLLANPGRAAQLGATARAAVKARHSFEAATARIAHCVRTVTEATERQ
jgi:starch synthase